MFYRVKQFIWGITAKFTKDDITFINSYLNEYERKLFFSLPIYEQVHSIKVARSALEESLDRNLYDIILIKAALLHDIGKINSGLNLITKSILVLGNNIVPNLIKKLIKVPFVNAYYNHPEIAMDYLKEEDNYIRYLIKNHHNHLMEGDDKLKILQKSDSEN